MTRPVIGVALFSTTLFFSAFLLFSIQPFVAKTLLPRLGGTPMVWNTCVVFFQMLVLAGYGAAHLIARRHNSLAPAWIYVVLLAGGLWFLPVAFGAEPSASQSPIVWLFSELARVAGLPVLALSMTAPLLQACYARTGLPRANDPYFLYAASNAGSFAALFAYPVAIEPMLRLSLQSRWWMIGYVACALLATACVVMTMSQHRAASAETAPVPGVGGWRRIRWVVLAFIPSSLMLGATTYITTDIAAVPLLWVVPLAIYLATFIVAFDPRLSSRMLSAWSKRAPFAVVIVTLLLAAGSPLPVYWNIAIHLTVFAIIALTCHCRLAADRPQAAKLTEFYLLVSAGGVAGGIFNTLVAPVAFNGIVEYPLMVAAASALPLLFDASTSRRELTVSTVAAAAIVATMAVLAEIGRTGGTSAYSLRLVVIGLIAIAAYTQSRQSLRFPLMIGALLLSTAVWSSHFGRVLHAERTFFGYYQITEDSGGRFRTLVHGTTLHGRQALEPGQDRTPLMYFHPDGPAGQAFHRMPRLQNASEVAVIGLGIGALAAYAGERQHWTFYEIDPAIKQMASDSRMFTFLSRCGSRCNVVLGDARLTLGRAAQKYDVLVLDAFSSDSIPMHLLTTEALELYLSRLNPGGVIVFHISNRYLRLADVIGRLMDTHRLHGVRQLYRVDPRNGNGAIGSEWIVASADGDAIKDLASDARWVTLGAARNIDLWTDDYSNILAVLGKDPR